MAVVRKVNRGVPFMGVSVAGIADQVTRKAIADTLDVIRRLRDHVGEIINFNVVKYFSQNGTPTSSDLDDGEMAMWKDADATSGNPTHYLVYRDGSDILTFASEETVP